MKKSELRQLIREEISKHYYMNPSYKRNNMKLKTSLYESFIDSSGNLIQDSSFVVMQTGFFSTKVIDLKDINVDDYIHFKTTYSNFDGKKVAREISKQVFQIYNNTSLKKWNDEVGYKPNYKRVGSSGLNSAALEIKLSEGKRIWKPKPNEPDVLTFGGWDPLPCELEIPISNESYTLDGEIVTRNDAGGKFFCMGNKCIDVLALGSGEKAKDSSELSSEEIDFQLQNTEITFIPYIHYTSYEKVDKTNYNRKSDLLDLLQDFGNRNFKGKN
jgi:hypothetical protein